MAPIQRARGPAPGGFPARRRSRPCHPARNAGLPGNRGAALRGFQRLGARRLHGAAGLADLAHRDARGRFGAPAPRRREPRRVTRPRPSWAPRWSSRSRRAGSPSSNFSPSGSGSSGAAFCSSRPAGIASGATPGTSPASQCWTEAARWLARELLSRGLLIIENLTGLDRLDGAGLLCLPLQLAAAGGAPARVVAIIR